MLIPESQLSICSFVSPDIIAILSVLKANSSIPKNGYDSDGGDELVVSDGGGEPVEPCWRCWRLDFGFPVKLP